MVKFIFKRTDGSVYAINNIPADMAGAIWNNIEAYCSMFENETIKVRTVIQKEQ